MMLVARPKKEGRRLSMILSEDLADQLDKLSKASGLTKTVIVEKALRKYITEKEKIIKKLDE